MTWNTISTEHSIGFFLEHDSATRKYTKAYLLTTRFHVSDHRESTLVSNGMVLVSNIGIERKYILTKGAGIDALKAVYRYHDPVGLLT